MKRAYIAIALVGLLVVSLLGLRKVWTQNRPDASTILIESARQMQHASYIGTVHTSALYYGKEINGQMRVYRYGCNERMEYLSAPMKGMIVVGNDQATYTYNPKAGRMLISPSGSSRQEEKRVNLLLDNYHAYMSGKDKVAGRTAYVVDITPKHPGNPSKRLWIDTRTHTVLGQDDISVSGSVKSQMKFEQIDFTPDIPASKFTVPSPSPGTFDVIQNNRSMSQEKLSEHLGFRVTVPSYIPDGYKLADAQLYKCQCKCPHNSAHIRYTDGLNSISIFETSVKTECCGKGMHRHGRGHGKGMRMKMRMGMGEGCRVGNCRQAQVGSVQAGDKSVVVVADLPNTEIERIAKSIK